MYKVIKYFIDSQDNNHEYNSGDMLPHDNVKVSTSRVKELAIDRNRRGEPLIEKVAAPTKTKTVNE